jgi:hypothetical protein
MDGRMTGLAALALFVIPGIIIIWAALIDG